MYLNTFFLQPSSSQKVFSKIELRQITLKKMSSVNFNQVHQQSSSKKVPKKNVICKHFNHNRCKFSKQCTFLHICRNFISGRCGSVKCSFDHMKLCPVLACNNKYVVLPIHQK